MDDLIYRNVLIDELKKIKFPCMLPSGAEYLEGIQTAVRRISGVINDAPAVNQWIPVKDDLPERDGEYLVFTEYEDVFKCTFDSNEESKWGFEQNYHDPDTLGWAGTTWTAVETVTHWMPLPKSPKEDDNDS